MAVSFAAFFFYSRLGALRLVGKGDFFLILLFARFRAFISAVFCFILSLSCVFTLLCCIAHCLMTAERTKRARPGNNHVSFFDLFPKQLYHSYMGCLVSNMFEDHQVVYYSIIPLWERSFLCFISRVCFSFC